MKLVQVFSFKILSGICKILPSHGERRLQTVDENVQVMKRKVYRKYLFLGKEMEKPVTSICGPSLAEATGSLIVSPRASLAELWSMKSCFWSFSYFSQLVILRPLITIQIITFSTLSKKKLIENLLTNTENSPNRWSPALSSLWKISFNNLKLFLNRIYDLVTPFLAWC